jgi:hypothetical protein
MGRRRTDRISSSMLLISTKWCHHLVRQIDSVLDLSWVHKELAPYYSHTGRLSIDPVLMIRMLIVGYVFAIRSGRRLCAEVQVNLAYRWFCGLGIEDKIPDHSVFCRARHERFRGSPQAGARYVGEERFGHLARRSKERGGVMMLLAKAKASRRDVWQRSAMEGHRFRADGELPRTVRVYEMRFRFMSVVGRGFRSFGCGNLTTADASGDWP